MPQTWAEGKQILPTSAAAQGSAEPATTASLREKNTSSNGHKLFLSIPCVTYLQDGQGKCAKDNKKLYL